MILINVINVWMRRGQQCHCYQLFGLAQRGIKACAGHDVCVDGNSCVHLSEVVCGFLQEESCFVLVVAEVDVWVEEDIGMRAGIFKPSQSLP